MGYGIYDGLVDGILLPLIELLITLPTEQLAGVRSTLIDALEMTTILLFLIINTILLIWFERKLVDLPP